MQKKSLRYGVIGTGAIGGYYGGRLANKGQEVHFLLHSDYEYVKEHGLQIDSVKGDFHLSEVFAYNDTSDMPKCDVVLVGLKTTNNYKLKDLLPPLIHKNTIVILIQNGLGVEEDLYKYFPDLNIAGGLAYICSSKLGKGHIGHFDEGRLTLGSYNCKDTSLLDKICSDFINAGVETKILDLEKARWMKLIWNIPYNGMTVVMNTTTDKLMKKQHMEELLHEIMLEVIRAANIVGKDRFSIPEKLVDQILDMTRTMVPYAPSMKLDFDSKRSLEIEYIYSRPIKEAMAMEYNMGRVAMLEAQLKFIESQYITKK